MNKPALSLRLFPISLGASTHTVIGLWTKCRRNPRAVRIKPDRERTAWPNSDESVAQVPTSWAPHTGYIQASGRPASPFEL